MSSRSRKLLAAALVAVSTLVAGCGALDEEAEAASGRSSVLRVGLPASAGATDLLSPAWTSLRWLSTAYGLPLPAG